MTPPRDGSKPSRRNLATRILNHLRGNAYESTLRLTLGCLLAKELGIRLQRIGSGDRLTFGPGERILSGWMAENAFVTWALRAQPWVVEESLIQRLSLPLNLGGDQHHRFYGDLRRIRSEARKQDRDSFS